MITQVEMCDVAKEIIELLKYLDSKFTSKIPEDVISKFKELATNSSLEVKIDIDKKLASQQISNEAKDIISILYYKYIATEEEKKELINIWKSNDELYKKAMQEKYNTENLFKDKNTNSVSIRRR